jgi:peptide/nickel transport system permease protein
MRAFRLRPAYLLAWGLMLLLLFTAILGSVIKPYPVKPGIFLEVIKAPVGGKFIKHPHAPDAAHWLGTDHRGLDMLSLILNGMKYTLTIALIITAIRFLVAVPLGLYCGTTGRGKRAISTMNWIMTAVPLLILLYPLLIALFYGLRLNMPMPMNHPNQQWFSAIFILSISFAACFPIAYQFCQRAEFFNDKLFVLGSRLMGASVWRIIVKHLLPNLRAELLFAFLTEYVQVLFLMGQLAILGVFFGGGVQLELDDGIFMSFTTTGEWCSLIAYGSKMVRLYPWIILSVIGFFVGSVLIIQFFLSQLKKQRRAVL